MKTIDVLLVGINSRFNHTNLAIRSITEYSKLNCNNIKNHYVNISFVEFTINQNLFDILNQIKKINAKLVMFSVYIWNVEITIKIINELKKIMGDILIGCGGPEVSYKANKILQENTNIDFIISGEGELVFSQLIENITKDINCYKNINGIYYMDKSNQQIIYTGQQKIIEDLSILPFPYPNIQNEKNKIFYYESSRGCPFNCSYCLSSIDKTVRFADIQKVFQDIQLFFDSNVPLVKFVDRTFNLKEDRYIKIWQYIIDNWNGITTIHFEIEAHILSQRAFEVLSNMPEHAIQFEIGIQSVNPKTLIACGRSPNFATIASNVKKIPKTIHVHLDLIAGLPYENINDFSVSFDKTILLMPDMLQLGFLKILSGTQMEVFAQNDKNYQWQSTSPYEVLSSSEMSWDDLQFLKQIEKLLDVYYNSQRFKTTIKYIIENYHSCFSFFSCLNKYFIKQNLIDDNHKPINYYEYFFDFINSEFCPSELSRDILIELLRFDFISQTKYSNFPKWYKHNYSKDTHHNALLEHTQMHSTRLEYAYSEYEEFCVNPFTLKLEFCPILFLYPKPDQKDSTKIILLP